MFFRRAVRCVLSEPVASDAVTTRVSLRRLVALPLTASGATSEELLLGLRLWIAAWMQMDAGLLLVAAVASAQGHSCPNSLVSTGLSAFRPAVPPLLVPGIPSGVLAPTSLSNLLQFELLFAGMLCKNVSNLRILYFY